MKPDDPRHGKEAGYVQHRRHGTDPCDPCRKAHAERQAKYRARVYLVGGHLWTDGTGTRRRLRALMALGWSGSELSRRLGQHRTYVDSLARRDGRRVHLRTARTIADLYGDLSDERPEGWLADRTRTTASDRGWLPPIWWDDIDNPNEVPSMRETNLPDPVVVDRILAGDWRLSATREERLEVLARWARSDGELERLTGWNVARDRRNQEARAA